MPGVREVTTPRASCPVGKDLVAERCPLQRMPDTLGQIMPSPPAQYAFSTVDAGVGASHVSGTSARLPHLDRLAGHSVKRLHQLPHCGAGASAEVDRRYPVGQGVESRQCGHMGRSQVPYVHVIPQPRAVPCWPVRPGDHERDRFIVRPDHLAKRVRRPGQLQSGPHLRIGTDRVEIPQRQHPKRPGRGDVGEHRFTYRLGPCVRALRVDRRVLIDGQVIAGPVDRRGRTEDESSAPVPQQVPREL